MIDWSKYFSPDFFTPKYKKEPLFKFLFSEATVLGIIYYKTWLFLCAFLAFVGTLLIITHEKQKPSLEEKKSNLEEEK